MKSKLWAPRPRTVEWLCGLVGVVLVYRYRWLLDDSTIYFRYVDNLLFLGRGVVFNEGEFVEGYSSPGWLLLLIPFRALRLDYWFITLLLGFAAYAAVWRAAIVVNRELAGPAPSAIVNWPLVYLSTAYGVTCYFTSGSESPLVLLAGAGCALYALRPDARWLQIALGALCLVRNELVIPGAVAVAFGWYALRRPPWWLIGSSLACGLGWTTFRIYYYADLFTVPFYLKDKVSFQQGLYSVVNTFGPEHFLWFLVPAVFAYLKARRLPDFAPAWRARIGMWAMGGASMAYVIKVGGDMMHFRLYAFPFVLLTLSLGGWVEQALARETARLRAAAQALSVLAGVTFFAAYPWFLSEHPWGREEKRELDHGISDAAAHRYSWPLTFEAPRWEEDRQRLVAYAQASSSHLGVATHGNCAPMFNDFENRYVHGYGLTEPFLARINVPEQRPAHKQDLVRLAKDLVTLRQLFPDTRAGVSERAMAAGIAPPWMQKNRAQVAMIEKRLYNQHEFLENLRNALKRIPRLDP
jgi:hypothetical protein